MSHINAKEHTRRHMAKRYDAANVLLDSYLDECVDCGNEDPFVLEFDHSLGPILRDGKGRRLGIRKFAVRGRAQMLNELALCEVRCANCHKRRHECERLGLG